MPPVVFDVLVIVVLLLINGVLAMAEIAIVTARTARLENRAAAGSRAARVALTLRANPTRFLSTIQVGITLVGILAGAFGGATLAEPLGNELADAGLAERWADFASVAIVVAAITYFSLVIGELVPKRVAMQHPEGMAVVLARPMAVLSTAMTPLVSVLAISTDSILRIAGVKSTAEEVATEDEIRLIVEQSSAAGIFEEGERDVIHRAMTLADHHAGELMTPRTKTDWLDLEDPIDVLRENIHGSHHNYLPVARGSLDELIGVAAVRDLLVLEPGPRFIAGIEAAARPGHFVPEGASAVALLELFKRTGTPVALVVDEYGGIQGVVTVTDVLEALVGDIGPDEASEPGIVQRPDGSYLVDGLFSIDEFKEQLGIEEELPDEPQYQTLAGFVLSQLGHIPTAAETFTFRNLQFEVIDMDGARVDKVMVSRVETEDAE